ncbi:SRPBCC domain-containing protein [Kangiella sp. HZ709]|uniref:SRPBCC family protein n=1 Tax=Kangiella sp. HZ709 TaxID=2666328 RepID=UPI0012B1435F|nr:SRPBCC domain-containing protein [Kangiella sp. HZ709]MRX28101.1 SRPBCC domain-containing protein [Kangiella sp. HZ709]
MATIYHKVGIKSSVENVYHALTTDEGLSGWWSSTTDGAGDIGSIINFRFNEILVQFQVLELEHNKKVLWKHHAEMPEAWMPTHVSFELEVTEEQVFVHFKQFDWEEQTPFYAHCNLKWAVFLLSLKDFLEKGQGQPFPNDVQIDHS